VTHWIFVPMIVGVLALFCVAAWMDRPRSEGMELQPRRHDAEPSPAVVIVPWPIDREEVGW